MFTVHYRGYWLHCTIAANAVRVQAADLTIMGVWPSLRAAKSAVRKGHVARRSH